MTPLIAIPTGLRKRRPGFTLIELLTVIAIIGILAAIIIPVVSKVRTSAKRAQGISNLRQIMVASLTYTQENRGRWFAKPNDDDGTMYTEVLGRYIISSKNKDVARSELFFDPLLPNTGHLHFAAIGIYFKDLISWQTALTPYNNFNNIKSPAKTVLFADNWVDKNVTEGYPGAQPYIMDLGPYQIWGYPGFTSTTDGNKIPAPAYGKAGAQIDLQRDPGQAKLGFLDGHVAIVKRENMKFSLFDPRYQ